MEQRQLLLVPWRHPWGLAKRRDATLGGHPSGGHRPVPLLSGQPVDAFLGSGRPHHHLAVKLAASHHSCVSSHHSCVSSHHYCVLPKPHALLRPLQGKRPAVASRLASERIWAPP